MKNLAKKFSIFFLMLFGFIALTACNGPIDPSIKDIEDVVFKDAEYVYDGEPHSIVIDGELPEGAVVKYENNEHTNAGVYRVKSTITCEGYKTLVLKATLTIKRKPIEDIYFRNQAFTYDGKTKDLSIIGELPEGVYVKYYGNNKTRVGKYLVRASFRDTTGNYKVPRDLYAWMTIEKADFDMSQVKFDGKSVVYDGKEHSLTISGNLPSGVSVSYENNRLTNAGTVHAIARFKHNNPNYNQIEPMTADLTIIKRGISGISFRNKNVVYDGNSHSIEITGTLPKGVTVTYENNGQINAGTYQVTAKFEDTTGNYNTLEPMTAELNIEKARFNMSGVSFNNETHTFDGSEYELTIKGNLPTGVTVTYENNKLSSVGTTKAVAKFSHNNPNYYEIEPMTANLTIVKSNIGTISFGDETFVYDGSEHSLSFNGTLPSGVHAVYENNNKVDAGTYKVTVTFVDTTGNYNVPNPMTAYLIIEKADFDMRGVSFESESHVFDGNEHELTIKGDLPEGVTVTYENNKLRNVGSVTAVAKFNHSNKNYNEIEQMTATLTITEKPIDSIIFENKKVTYDGKPHNIEITGQLPEGVTVEYSANGFIDVGNYPITATFKDPFGNYPSLKQMTAYLIIEKADFDMSGVKFESESHVYDGNEYELVIKGKLPEGVKVTYEDNKLTNVGTTKAVAKFSHNNKNYNAIKDKNAYLTITKATLSGVTLKDMNVVYNGEPYTMEITGKLPAGLKVEYKNNVQTNAERYKVEAHFVDEFNNYNQIDNMVAYLTINKADFDMSGITFDSESHVYDGKEHELVIKGKLPEGVTVTYENNKLTEVGTTTAIARFSHNNPNYNEINSMTATLTITNADIKDISFVDKTVDYNGKPHKIEISGVLPEGVTVEYTPTNTYTDAGNHEITAKFIDSTGNYGKLEPMTATLKINTIDFDMSGITFDSESHVYDGKEHELVIKGELPEGVTVTYEKNKLTNSGTTEAVAKFTHSNPNYNAIKDKNANLTITKKVITGITFNSQTVTYNEESQTIEVSGKLPSGVTVKYSPTNAYTNVGTHEITATFVDNNENKNYILPQPMTAKLTIEQAEVNMSGVTFEDETHTYDGKEHELVIKGQLPEGVTVTYESNKLTEVGTTTAIARFSHNNPNYKEINFMRATLTISEPNVEGISFSGDTVVYDTHPHTIEITGTLPSGVKVEYTPTNTYTDAGNHEITATLKYETSNKTITSMTATLVINKADIDMSGVKFESESHVYDGKEHELVIKGELPSGVTVTYESNKLTNAESVTAVAKFTHSDKNYNEINSMRATLTITQATIEGISFNGKTVIYNKAPHTIEVSGKLPSGVTVKYSPTNTYTDAGDHEITATFVDNNVHKNYILPQPMTATLVINKADFDMKGVTFESESHVYDEHEHTLLIKGKLPEGVTVTYEKNKLTNVGTTEAVAKFSHSNPNYNKIEPMTATLTITQATIEGISFADKTVDYNKAPHTIEVSGKLPNGVTVEYTPTNTYTDAGDYEVTATFVDNNVNKNYILPQPMTATLKINKIDFDMSGITFESESHVYDGNEHELLIKGELPSGVTVTYENNKLTNFGTTKAVAKFTHSNPNYNAIKDKNAYLTITKATLSGVTLEDMNVVYNGEPYTMEITGKLPVGLKVEYKNNVQTNANRYKVEAHFVDEFNNYNQIDDMVAYLTIDKAEVNMNGVTFEDETHVYDKEEHELLIKGKLPGGVIATYENNKLTNVGFTNAKVTFTYDDNHYGITSLIATLEIIKADYDMSKVEIINNIHTFDNQSHSLGITGLPNGVTVAMIEGSNQTNAGTYPVTITFAIVDKLNYNIPDPIETKLIINKADYDLRSVVFESKTFTYDGESHSLVATGLPEGLEAVYTSNNALTDVDEVQVTLSFKNNNTNYNDVNETIIKTLKVVPLEVVIPQSYFESKQFVYNNKEYKLEVTKPLPEGVSIDHYVDNTRTIAGKQTAKVYFAYDKNHTGIEYLEATLEVIKADYDMSQVKIINNIYTFDETSHSLEVTGLPNGVTVANMEGNNQINAGNYPVTITFANADTLNYNTPNSIETELIINKKKLSFEFRDMTVDYDGNTKTMNVIGEIPESVHIVYENNYKINAGDYTVTATFTDNSGNYDIPKEMKAKLTINKAKLNIDKSYFEDIVTTYTGSPIAIYAKPLPEGAQVDRYVNNIFTNVCNETATVYIKYDDNHTGPEYLTAVFIINKASYDLSQLRFENETYEYDKQEHTLEAIGVPAGLQPIYSPNKLTNFGSIKVQLSFNNTNPNYNDVNDIYEKTLTITKKELKIDNSYFTKKVVDYNGFSQEVLLAKELPEGVIGYVYDNNKQTDVGTYNATVTFTYDDNYTGPTTLKTQLIINPLKLEFEFNGLTVEYDGQTHPLSISGEYFPSGVEVNYINNNQTDVGTHEVIAEFTYDKNHTGVSNLTAYLKITPTNYSVIDKVQFEDSTIIYDGNFHELKIKGAEKLPSWITVRYENNKIKEGSTTAKVYFDHSNKNYNPINPLEATLTIDRPLHHVTFKQVNDGQEIAKDIIIDVLHMDRISVLPPLKDVEGYTVKWEKVDLSCVTNDLTVNAIYTPDKLGVQYYIGDVLISEEEMKFNDQFTVKSLKVDDKITINEWFVNDQKFVAGNTYQFTYHNTLKLVSNVVEVEDYNASDYNFTLDTNTYTATITKYNGINSDVIVPTYLAKDGVIYVIDKIGDYAFSGNTNIETISISNKITSLGDSVFEGCSSLLQFSMPESVTTIGVNLFADCTSLEKVILPESIDTLPDYMFMNCNSLQEVNIPRSVLTIGAGVFTDCQSLTAIVLHKDITSIGLDAFSTNNGYNTIVYNEKPFDIDDLSYEGWGNSGAILWNYGGKRGITSDGLVWALTNDGQVSIVQYIGTKLTYLDIPEVIEGYPVNAINQYAIGYYNKNTNNPLEVIRIHENIEIIQEHGIKKFENAYMLLLDAPEKPKGWEKYWESGFKNVVFNYGGGPYGYSDGFYYAQTKDNVGAIYSYYSETTKEILIVPSEINGVKITVIKDHAININYKYRRVIIEEGITDLEYYAFNAYDPEFVIPSTLKNTVYYSIHVYHGAPHVFLNLDKEATSTWNKEWLFAAESGATPEEVEEYYEKFFHYKGTWHFNDKGIPLPNDIGAPESNNTGKK